MGTPKYTCYSCYKSAVSEYENAYATGKVIHKCGYDGCGYHIFCELNSFEMMYDVQRILVQHYVEVHHTNEFNSVPPILLTCRHETSLAPTIRQAAGRKYHFKYVSLKKLHEIVVDTCLANLLIGLKNSK